MRSIVITLAAFATRSIKRLTEPLAPGIGGMGTPHSAMWAPVGISAASLAPRVQLLPSNSQFFGSAFADNPRA